MDLRREVSRLEETQRRFASTISISEAIDSWLPNGGLPVGCVHEVKGSSLACAIAFSALLSARLSEKKTILYAAPDESFHPLGLLPYGVKLDQLIHVHARRSQDLSWTVLEALRCPQVGAVLAVMEAKDLTVCRRLQIGAENSGATGFLLGNNTSAEVASAVTRWRISPRHGHQERGFEEAFWTIELIYCRGGRPAKWVTTCRNQRLETADPYLEVAAKPAQRTALPARDALAG